MIKNMKKIVFILVFVLGIVITDTIFAGSYTSWSNSRNGGRSRIMFEYMARHDDVEVNIKDGDPKTIATPENPNRINKYIEVKVKDYKTEGEEAPYINVDIYYDIAILKDNGKWSGEMNKAVTVSDNFDTPFSTIVKQPEKVITRKWR